jgi:hypothetical protein
LGTKLRLVWTYLSHGTIYDTVIGTVSTFVLFPLRAIEDLFVYRPREVFRPILQL